jgi:hypothetical protein
MCTYDTAQRAVIGSGKGTSGWFGLTTATVYFDHPVHAQDEHTLNLDFAAPERGASARVAVELSARSAVALCEAVAEVLLSAPGDITGLGARDVAGLRRMISDRRGYRDDDGLERDDIEEAPAAGMPAGAE